MAEPNWQEMKGGYGVPYDPRPAIARLHESPSDSTTWDELWSELHHQGDLGEASLAAVPLLVEALDRGPRDWNFFGLIATIETERHRKSNPELPDWLAERYHAALQRAKELALSDLSQTPDEETALTALSVVALALGSVVHGALLSQFSSTEVRELVDEQMAWTELYREEAL